MTPRIETLDPRRLFTALTPDPSFAGGRGVALPGGIDVYALPGRSLLATHGAVYVSGFSPKGVFHVLKYTDAGTLDTAWGDGGTARPRITRGVHDFHNDASLPALIYDARTGGLILANGGGGRTVSVERFNAEGRDDTAWATGGVAEFTAAKGTTLALDAVVPLAGKKLAIAVTRAGGRDESDDLLLARVGRTGRVETSFNGGRFVTVMGGHSRARTFKATSDFDGATDPVDDSLPHFGDLRVTDAGYRVIGVRQRTTGSVRYGHGDFDERDFYYTTRTKLSVESTVVAADGTVAAAAVTPLVRGPVESLGDLEGDSTSYRTVLAQAYGDDGVVTLVGRGYADDVFERGATVTQIDAGRATSAEPLVYTGDLSNDRGMFRDSVGRTYLWLNGAINRYSPRLKLDAAFDYDGRDDTFVSTVHAADDAGRILTAVFDYKKKSSVLTRLV